MRLFPVNYKNEISPVFPGFGRARTGTARNPDGLGTLYFSSRCQSVLFVDCRAAGDAPRLRLRAISMKRVVRRLAPVSRRWQELATRFATTMPSRLPCRPCPGRTRQAQRVSLGRFSSEALWNSWVGRPAGPRVPGCTGQSRAEIHVEIHGSGLRRQRAFAGKKKGRANCLYRRWRAQSGLAGAEIRPSYDSVANCWVVAGR